jgi:HD-like signal output (HDOD) protein
VSTALSQILEEIKSLEPLPEIALRVTELASRDDVVPRDLVAVIQTDAGTTAKVLKLCNSAFYGFQREIGSLQDAANMLGVSPLVNLVLTSCAERYFRDYGYGSRDRQRRQWESSVLNALSACLLARLHGKIDRNRAYTLGLLQNVGQLIVARFLAEQADEVAGEVARGVSLLEAEESILGMNHAEVGARLAERWLFPDVLVDAIRFHHEPEKARHDLMLTSIGHLGEVVTQAFVMGEGLEQIAYGLNESALGLTGLDRGKFESMEQVLVAELDKAREFLEIHDAS